MFSQNCRFIIHGYLKAIKCVGVSTENQNDLRDPIVSPVTVTCMFNDDWVMSTAALKYTHFLKSGGGEVTSSSVASFTRGGADRTWFPSSPWDTDTGPSQFMRSGFASLFSGGALMKQSLKGWRWRMMSPVHEGRKNKHPSEVPVRKKQKFDRVCVNIHRKTSS